MNPSMNTTLKSVTSEQLIEDLKKVAEDSKTLLRDISSYPADRLTSARSQLEERFRTVKSKVDDMRNSTVDSTIRAADITHRYVTDNPWKSLAIMAGAISLVALLVSRGGKE